MRDYYLKRKLNDGNKNIIKPFIMFLLFLLFGFSNYSLHAQVDTDGDGIVDSIDLDDDNDGILDDVECGCISNVFTNGDFELPDIPDNTYQQISQSAVPGWSTTAGDGLIEIWGTGFNGVPAQNGGQFAEINATQNATLYQTFCVNGMGGTIDWSIWHRARIGTDVAHVLIGENIATATVQATMTDGTSAWGHYTGTYTIPIGQTQVVIAFQSISTGSGSLSVGNFIDNVEVTFNMVCVDTDADGIPNSLDTDSDGDGCPDAVEYYNDILAVGSDGNEYYGTGNPPAVNPDGTVIGASYTGSYANVTSAGSSSTVDTQPVDQSGNEGDAEAFSVSASSGSGTTVYQWQESTDGGTTWNNLTDGGIYSGATSNTLTLTGVTATMDGYDYKVQITQSDFICGLAESNSAKLFVNSIPVATDDAGVTDEDVTLTVNATNGLLANDTDADGDPLEVTEFIVGGNTYPIPSGGNATATLAEGTLMIYSDGSYEFVPTPNYNGTVPTITYTVSDGLANDTADLIITVNAVDDYPIADDDVFFGSEDSDINGDVSINDTLSGDGGNIFTLLAGPSNGTIVFNGDGTFIYTPAPNFFGTDTFTYNLCDVDGDCNDAVVTLSITSVDDFPDAVDDTTEVTDEDTPLSSTVATNDTLSGDGGNAYSLVSSTTHGTLTLNPNGTYLYMPSANYYGPDSFTYSLCDADGDCDTAVVNITVNSVNDVPVANDDVITTNEDTAVSGATAGNDVLSGDGGNTWSLVGANGGAAHGTVTMNPDGTYYYTPATNYNGTDTFTYQLCDVNNDCDQAIVTVTINSVNDVPYANNDLDITNEDTPLLDSVAGNDIPSGDGGNTWSLVGSNGGALNGSVTMLPNGDYIYAPNLNYSGTDVFTYTLCDVNGDCSTASAVIYVIPVNDPPVAVDDVATTLSDTNVDIVVTANDSDIDGYLVPGTIDLDMNTSGQQTTITIPGEGTYTSLGNGTVVFDPLPSFEGITTPISYTINDNQGATSNIATITVGVGACLGNPVLDCDGDGVSNGQEIKDGTDPDDMCSYIVGHQILVPSVAWDNADCDGDCYTNGEEVSMGTNPLVFNFDPMAYPDGASTVSCPVEAEVEPITPTITDNCGTVYTLTLYNVTAVPSCEGDVVYTYTYTDGGGNTHDWIYTYTIEYQDFVMPANGSSTVSCYADAIAPELPLVTDNCGEDLEYVDSWVDGTSSGCDGTVVYYYEFEDCSGHSHTWRYTYTIEMNDFVIDPSTDGSTVACASDISTSAITLPVVTDSCGNILTPSGPFVSALPSCEGDVTYTYTYIDCSGHTQDFVYTFTIVYEDFTGNMPEDSGETVSCESAIGTPPVPSVQDNCGNDLVPSGPVVYDQRDGTCEGDILYTYTYTDCSGNTHDWVYTYTIVYEDFVMPLDVDTTVGCASDVVAPVVPTVVDACGTVLVPSGPVVSIFPECEGDVTYTYTFTDCAYNTHDWVYTYHIVYDDFVLPSNGYALVDCPLAVVEPTPPTVYDSCGTEITPLMSSTEVPECEGDVVYTYTYTDCSGHTQDWLFTYVIEYDDFAVPSNQGSTVACASEIVVPTPPTVLDNCGNELTPEMSVSSTPVCEGDVFYTFTYTDCEGNTHDWVYTYTIDYQDFVMPVNGSSTVSCIANAVAPELPLVTDNCGQVLMNPVSNWTGGTYDGCEGTRVYYYEYQDCAGYSHVWEYAYTIERDNFDTTMPANAESQVSCAGDIVAPSVPLVTDNCGNVLSPSSVTVSSIPSCEGDVIYTYTFTDCEGNSNDWTYTYHIVYEDFVMPADAGETISCPSALVMPVVPTVIDACGEVLVPSVPVISSIPACEGDVTYTYTFTDCAGFTHDWVYTYTIEYQDFVIPVSDKYEMVTCPSEADAITPVPPVVYDHCGNELTPTVSVSTTPECEGDKVWTYTYVDCEGNTHDWNYVVEVDFQGDLVLPANGGEIIYDVDDALDPGSPAPITDSCGRTVYPVLVGVSYQPYDFECEGNIIWTYRYTACDGITTADWTYTYDVHACVIPTGFSPNADGHNDVWYIPGLTNHNYYTLEVYDRWGNLVWEYDRTRSVDPQWWDAKSTGRMTLQKGELVPAGTYFYILKYNDGETEPKTGWVYVNY